MGLAFAVSKVCYEFKIPFETVNHVYVDSEGIIQIRTEDVVYDTGKGPIQV